MRCAANELPILENGKPPRRERHATAFEKPVPLLGRALAESIGLPFVGDSAWGGNGGRTGGFSWQGSRIKARGPVFTAPIHRICTVSNGSGTVALSNVTSVLVTCR